MHKRVFLDSQDFYDKDNHHYFYRALEFLLTSLIKDKFDWMDEAEIYLDDVEDAKDNKVIVKVRISSYINLGNDEYYETSDFIETYYILKKKILSRLRKELTNITENAMLMFNAPIDEPRFNPEQFTIKTHKIDMRANVGIGTYDNTSMSKEIHLDLLMSFEDISGYEPGEPQALYTKYKYLCKLNTRDSTRELERWVSDLGIDFSDRDLSRREMCKAIAEYYGY